MLSALLFDHVFLKVDIYSVFTNQSLLLLLLFIYLFIYLFIIKQMINQELISDLLRIKN